MEKTADLPQVNDKLKWCLEYTLPWAGFELTASVIAEDRFKSNYRTSFWLGISTNVFIFKYYPNIYFVLMLNLSAPFNASNASIFDDIFLIVIL